MEEIIQQIRYYVQNDRLREALDLLLEHAGDGTPLAHDILTLSRTFSSLERQKRLGHIDFSKYDQEASILSSAILDSTQSLPRKPVVIQPPPPSRKVFISYNHGDTETALRVRDYLQENNVQVIIDEDDMPPGMDIMSFIQSSIRDCDVVLSIVSGRSLQSGWVGKESVASLYAIWLADRKFIPVRLDGVVFDDDFQIEAQEKFLQKIKEQDRRIKKLKALQGDPSAAEDDRRRLNDIKHNLGNIIMRLRNVLVLDVSGDKFETNMPRVLREILE